MFMKICLPGESNEKEQKSVSLRLGPDLYAKHQIHLSSCRRQTEIHFAYSAVSTHHSISFRITHMGRNRNRQLN